VKKDPSAIELIPEVLRTPEVCAAAAKNSWVLRHVPASVMSEEICLAAARNNPHGFERVSPAWRTPAVCLEAVRQNGTNLSYVPEALKTPELCLEAVKQNGYALRYVPEALRTPELCVEAVKQAGKMLDSVPENAKALAEKSLVRQKQLIYDIKMNPHQGISGLQFVPEAERTRLLCEAAVQGKGLALALVPMELRSESLCFNAVKQDGFNFSDVPDVMKDAVYRRFKNDTSVKIEDLHMVSDWYYARARFKIQTKKGRESVIADLTKAIDLYANFKETPDFTAKYYDSRADEYYDSREQLDPNLDKTLADLNDAIRSKPEMDRYSRRAQVLELRGDFEGAARDGLKARDLGCETTFVNRLIERLLPNVKHSLREFVYTDERVSKFWSIEAFSTAYIVRYGKVGDNGHTVYTFFDTAEACEKAVKRAVTRKVKEGYAEKDASAQ
jgi:predicted DNA-binding WGR domain protein/tetratricopeptide (TPR) repeat protein